MNIAIGGEGDAPAMRCGATMKINGDIATTMDNEFDTGDAFATYLTGLEVVDTDFESQAVTGVPIEVEGETYAPVVVGITKSLGEHIDSLWDDDGYRCEPKIIVDEDDDISGIYTFVCWGENDNAVLVFLVPVDGLGTTTLAEDNWSSLELTYTKEGAEDIVETYDFITDTTFGPTELSFTRANIE